MNKQTVDYQLVIKNNKAKNDQYSIKVIKNTGIYSEEQILRYLANPENISWVKTDNLLDTLNDACVDGRETEQVIASPGGDTAILAEAIISIGKLLDRKLDPVEIRKVFKWRVSKMGSFYYHTDTHALENLRKSLNADKEVGKQFKTTNQVYKFVTKPPVKLQSVLLSHLFKIENVGCGHLKLMLAEPEAYGVSRKVIQGILRAYFNMMWNGSRQEKKQVMYRVLEGGHKEGAVVVIRVAGKLNEKAMVPAVRPTDGKISMFVFHPQMTEFMHDKLAVEIAKSGVIKEINKRQVKEFKKVMSQVNTEGLRETVSRLAFGLPLYTFELKIKK